MEGMLAPRETAVCAAYMFLASAMWVVNKKTVKHLPVPFFVMLTQALATCVILKTLQRLRVVRMRPWRWEIFGEWLKTGFVWAVPLALNLRALTRLNPETLIVFRTATLIGVTFGDHAYGKRFQRREMASIVVILVGCAFYAWYDAQYDAEGYAWATLYWFAMVVSMLYVKHSFSVHKDLSIWDKTAYLSATAAAPLALFSLLFECTSSEYEELSLEGGTWLLASCLMGAALASASNKSRDFYQPPRSTSCPRRANFSPSSRHPSSSSRRTRRSPSSGCSSRSRGGVAVFPGGNVVSAMRGVSRRGRGRGRAGGGFRRRGKRQPGSTEGGHVGERRGGRRRRTKGETVNGEG